MEQTNDKALTAFIAAITDIQGQLTILTMYADNHMEVPPDDVDWGHVGSARHVLELLTEATAFLNLR